MFNNLLKPTDDSRFSVSTLCQLFSGEQITLDFATQQRRTIPSNSPFGILGGIQLKPTVVLTQAIGSQGSGLLDRVMICAPKCLPPSMASSHHAAQCLSTKTYTPDFNLCMKEIHNAHPFGTEEGDIIYKFSPEAMKHVTDLHETFNNSFVEAITEGRPTQTSKNIELMQRVAVALYALDNTLQSVINNTDISFNNILPLSAVERAAKYVMYWESQKEIIVKVKHIIHIINSKICVLINSKF